MLQSRHERSRLLRRSFAPVLQAFKTSRAFVKKEIRRHLAEADPRQTSRNKFRLLRLGRWRVFYRLRDERVEIVLVGEKRGNTLLIGGEEFKL